MRCRTAELVKKVDQRMEKRLSVIEQDLDSVQKGHSSLEASQATQQKAIEQLQQALAVAEACVPIKDTLDLNEFNRRVDCTILRINTSDLVSKPEVERALRPWLMEAGCDDGKAKILGPDSSRRFVVQFKGSAHSAKLAASKARSLLRGHDGSWRHFEPPSLAAGGGTTDIYINVDKNRCQQKRERDFKWLRGSFVDKYPNKKSHFNRVDGLTSYKGVPLAQLEPQNDNLPSDIKWNLAAVADAAVDREDIKADYKLNAKTRTSAADVQWSG